jgi:hypothetical protein
MLFSDLRQRKYEREWLQVRSSSFCPQLSQLCSEDAVKEPFYHEPRSKLVKTMKKPFITFVLATVIAGAGIVSSIPAFAENVVPCEDMLSQLNEAMATAKLSDADKAKVQDLKKKGVAECKRDKDAEADTFFQQAIDMTKKK